MLSAEAKPYAFQWQTSKACLLVIDMQKDFLEPGGFGEIQGGDLARVQAIVPSVQRMLDTARRAGMTVIHTREGHKPDLSDCPTPKLQRQKNAPNSRSGLSQIGVAGPAGSRLLVRGEPMHDLVDACKALPGEVVIDKPGKGAFYDTDLHVLLSSRSISHIFVAGVTTECCVTTTAREANDRGFEVCILGDCTDGYVESFKTTGLDMFCFSDGLFGYTASSSGVIAALEAEVPAAPKTWSGGMSIAELQSCYKAGVVTPEEVVTEVYNRIEGPEADPAVWLHLIPKAEALARAKELLARYPTPETRPPLFGIPFSIKDSIDYAGVPTTGACPAYSFVPEKHATTTGQLLDAGAICIGKVNLDQLATGLVGMRSPYGQPASVFSKLYVSGGSSSGSAVSVAAGEVSFSLATDTAGSGRVPAAFNNIVGFKGTRGTVSCDGVVPCCPALDCIAVESLSPTEARQVYNVLRAFDPTDEWAKVAVPYWATAPRAILQPKESFKFAIPPAGGESREYLCPEFEKLFVEAVKLLESPAVGGLSVDSIDYKVFEDAGRTLYEGSFVADRVASIQEWYDANPATDEGDPLLPEIRSIYASAAKNFSALDAWNDARKQARLQRKTQQEFAKFQVLVVPTAPLHPTKEAYNKDPIGLNHKLGKFTHFGNILDLVGIAIPAGLTPDGMPFGITILGQSFTEGLIFEVAERFGKALGLKTGKL